MKLQKSVLWAILLLLMLILAACGGSPVSPTVNPEVLYTQAVETFSAEQTKTALSRTKTPTISPSPQVTTSLETTRTTTPTSGTKPASTTSLTAGTMLASNTPKATSAPATTSQPSCDNGIWLADVTIDDYTELDPGSIFDKTWRVLNTGECTWNPNYRLIWGWGTVNDWVSTQPENFTSTVEPNQEMEITVSLTAPIVAGTHEGYFRLQNDKGYTFGQVLSVIIKVPETAAP